MGENRNKDRRKNKRKGDQRKVFGHSSNETKVNQMKVHKQKNHRYHKSDKKYHPGGSH
ncbi:MAG: hypothetical protein PHH83_02800 [Patescibacteria group bacterium]|nr:hypothetical protein [Patescibacteria group bacterium]